MITRIVKLEFEDQHIPVFMGIFAEHALMMESVPGCMSLELVQDILHPKTLFTISIWQREEDLESYRTSELFNIVWSKIKPLFAGRPYAWTTQSIYHGKN